MPVLDVAGVVSAVYRDISARAAALAAAAMLRGKLQQIRAVRLAGKEAIAAGVKSVEQVEAELDAL